MDLSSPDTFISDVPHSYFAHLRSEEPVAWCAESDGGSGFWSVTRYTDVALTSRNTSTFSSAKGGSFIADLAEEQLAQQRLLLINMDPPAHARYRQLVTKGFTPKSVTLMERTVRERARALLDNTLRHDPCDVVAELAAQLPLQIICDLLGVPESDHAQVLVWSNQLMAGNDTEYNAEPGAVDQAGAEAFSYFHALAEDRRARPSDDLITTLVEAELEGEHLSELEVGLFCVLLLVGGNETTRTTIAHGVLALAEHPNERQRLSADLSLVTSGVEEMLRYGSALMSFRRTATTNTIIGNQAIAEGDKVILWYVSANRDDTVFHEPDVFDVTRIPNPHLAFGGGGPHVCLGASLARMQLRVLFEELLGRVEDIELVGKPVRLRSNFLNGLKHLSVRFA